MRYCGMSCDFRSLECSLLRPASTRMGHALATSPMTTSFTLLLAALSAQLKSTPPDIFPMNPVYFLRVFLVWLPPTSKTQTLRHMAATPPSSPLRCVPSWKCDDQAALKSRPLVNTRIYSSELVKRKTTAVLRFRQVPRQGLLLRRRLGEALQGG